jgi:hypothetical protein
MCRFADEIAPFETLEIANFSRIVISTVTFVLRGKLTSEIMAFMQASK